MSHVSSMGRILEQTTHVMVEHVGSVGLPVHLCTCGNLLLYVLHAWIGVSDWASSGAGHGRDLVYPTLLFPGELHLHVR